jgi:hypothetical protein
MAQPWRVAHEPACCKLKFAPVNINVNTQTVAVAE